MAYKNTFEAGMFDQEFTIEALSGIGNCLVLKIVDSLWNKDEKNIPS